MGYHTILFDMDGTLLDTLDDLADSVNAVLREMGYPTRSLDEVRTFVGNGAEMLVRRALGGERSEEEVAAVLKRYQAYYAAHCQIKTKPYPGIVELIARLHAAGKKLAVVSNKPDGAVKTLNRQYFSGLMDAAVGEAPDVRRKPWPDMVDESLRALGEEKDGAVYVGDSEVDVQTAKNAGLPLIAVSWGFRGREALRAAGADTIVDTAEELLAAIG